MIYIISLIILVLALYFYFKSNFLKKLSFPILRIYLFLHYLFLMSGGYLISIFIKNSRIKNIPEFFLISFSLFSLFQSALILNDYFDRKGDRYVRKTNPFFDKFNRKEVIFYFTFFTLSSLLIPLFSKRLFMVFLLSHILHIIYSMPPLRLKKYFPLNLLCLGTAALFSFMMGFGINLPFKQIPLKIYILIFLALTPAISFRDLLDTQGDKILNVRTLPVIFGEKKGRIYSAFLILYSYFVIPIILRFPYLYIVCLPLGLLSFFEVKKKNMNQLMVFNLYFMLLFSIIISVWFYPQIIL